MKLLIKIACIFGIIALIAVSCRKEEFYKDDSANLNFSKDTLTFDTVFTKIGSTTLSFKVYNPYKQPVKISRIFLAGGDESNFRLNIDGYPSNDVRDMEIAIKDSLFIFVEVTVDPNNANNPMVIRDSIGIVINGNSQFVQLVAWGQDANIYYRQTIGSEIWNSTKPYLVYDYVYVDSTATLTIQPGTKIYFHKYSGLFVKGKLLIQGTTEEPVILQGDRLEDYYEDVPGQWGGIRIYSGSIDNQIENTVIKNAIVGIQVGTLDDTLPSGLILLNSRVENMNYAGLYTLNASVFAGNTLFANCGFYAVAILVGGSYDFYHCTVANSWGYGNRTEPSVVISNNAVFNEALYLGNLSRCNWGNCIIYGSQENEIEFGSSPEASFNFKFDHSLIKIDPEYDTGDTASFSDIIKNKDPKFKDPSENNYELDTLSVAQDKGTPVFYNLYPFLENDMNGEPRNADSAPDLGAYERQE